MYGPKPKPPSERFWSKVRKGGPDECWEWTAKRDPGKYGVLFSGQQGLMLKAHRVSWEMANCQPVPDELCVLHHCDNPPCVNPKHLYVGTRADNVRDRAARKRGKEHRQSGAANDNAKLTEADVLTIRRMNKQGCSQTELARLFGVNQPQVSRIIRRVNWCHLPEEKADRDDHRRSSNRGNQNRNG